MSRERLDISFADLRFGVSHWYSGGRKSKKLLMTRNFVSQHMLDK